MEHTKTPWTSMKITGSIYTHVRGPEGLDIFCGSREDADFIVRCVNAHEKMVEALQETLGCLIEYYHRYDEMPDNLATQFNIDMESRLERAKSALALAEK